MQRLQLFTAVLALLLRNHRRDLPEALRDPWLEGLVRAVLTDVPAPAARPRRRRTKTPS